MNHLEWIEQQILNLQREIAKYEIAREVIMEASKVVRPPKLKVLSQPKPKQQRKGRHNSIRQLVRNEILAYLNAQSKPLTSTEIFVEIEAHRRVADSTLWKAMKELRQEGLIQKNVNREYTVVHEKINGTNG